MKGLEQAEAQAAGLAVVPRHVAIIMDGNRRWARQHGTSVAAGHRAGVENVRVAVRTCADVGVEFLTLYAFSTENWKRGREEVDSLWALAVEFLHAELPELLREGVRVRVIGRREELPPAVRRAAHLAETATRHNRRLHLVLAMNYGARQEIVAAARSLASACASGRLRPEDIDERAFADALWTRGLPDPDLVIRTSGEQRVSNFLLWQIAYSELWTTKTCWPDFSREELLAALRDYASRRRRFGGSDEDATPSAP
jgi:undecaprenyl diphosphate synthase